LDRNNLDLVLATAQAGKLGNKLIYLEAGSGENRQFLLK
jgi:hypothetical protein